MLPLSTFLFLCCMFSTSPLLMSSFVHGWPSTQNPQQFEHLSPGNDILLTLDEHKIVNPGSLIPTSGRCIVNQTQLSNNKVPSSYSTITESINACLHWCINYNTETQRDMTACEVFELTSQQYHCKAFPAAFPPDNNLSNDDKHKTSDTQPNKYTCFDLMPSRHRRTENEHAKRGLSLIAKTWPNGVIPYTILQPGHPDSWADNGKDQAAGVATFLAAIHHYHNRTNLMFRPRQAGDTSAINVGYYTGGCGSYLGYHGWNDGQTLMLGWCMNYVPFIIHELGHVAGLWHEHQREDRDTYINVPENLPQNAAHNFMKATNTDSRGLDYDFASIMHYPMSTSWSGYGTVTMTMTEQGLNLYTEQGSPQIGGREELSDLDVQGLNLLYPGTPTTSPTPPPGSSPPTMQPSSSSPTTLFPTTAPTTFSPSTSPTINPTFTPSHAPTLNPISSPTHSFPTMIPTTSSPTNVETLSPSLSPSLNPTSNPSTSPTLTPTQCTDMYPNGCALWAIEGKCSVAQWYRDACPMSCGVCHSASPTPSPTMCVDVYPNGCALWAIEGQCSQSQWYRDTCPMSCGICNSAPTPAPTACVDTYVHGCVDWANQGKCNEGQWYKDTCPLSCGLCTVAPTPAPTICIDTYPDGCALWASEGKCSETQWYKDTCPKSCNVC